MTDADPMLAWLRGALTTAQSEAEAAAEATGSANWQYEPSGYLDATSPAGGMVAVGAHDFLEPDRGRFVAAHTRPPFCAGSPPTGRSSNCIRMTAATTA